MLQLGFFLAWVIFETFLLLWYFLVFHMLEYFFFAVAVSFDEWELVPCASSQFCLKSWGSLFVVSVDVILFTWYVTWGYRLFCLGWLITCGIFCWYLLLIYLLYGVLFVIFGVLYELANYLWHLLLIYLLVVSYLG